MLQTITKSRQLFIIISVVCQTQQLFDHSYQPMKYEGPKRRPEGGEWEPIKILAIQNDWLKIPSTHPTLES